MAISFSSTKVARFAGALYGVALNNNTYNQALSEIYMRGFDAVANEVFAADFGSQSTSAVGSVLAANLGLTGQAAADAVTYISAQLNGVAANARGAVISNILSTFAGLETDATYGAAAIAFNARVDSALRYSNDANNVQHGTLGGLDALTVLNLTTGFDKLTGTSGADSFLAYSVNNTNSLQDGDMLKGGSGSDTLFADITSGTLATGAITPNTNSVEWAKFRVQHNQSDSGDNNIASVGVGIIDAERMVGTNIYEDNNSRADLVVEDVRIGASQITKDITVIMRDTDPGAVDYALYFDQNSLRNTSSATSTINLRVLDTYAKAQGLAELKDSPYGSFSFYYSEDGGATYTKAELTSQGMQDAQTIDAMVIAMQAQVDAKFGAGKVTVNKGAIYTVPDSVTSNPVSSNEIAITTNASIQFDTTRTGSGWKATDVVPAVSGLYTSFNTAATSSAELVTSTVILDHVGRGSNGGDLIIGGLSTGVTSASKGVQQFNITVEDTSKLSNITSTNNTLQVVNIVNGTTDVQSDAYVTRVQNAGDLYVGVANDQDSDLLSGPQNHEDSAYGFNDVRVIDGSAMAGKLNFTAEVTSASIAKYLNLGDTASSYTADNVAFTYSGGGNNDAMSVVIDGTVLASNTLSGREDFSFTINGNNGNDTITVDLGGLGANATGTDNRWEVDQFALQNVAINGGAGNDTINAVGDGLIKIDASTGDDTVYVDNTGVDAAGSKGTWVIAAQNTAVTDLQSADNAITTAAPRFLYGGTLRVTFSAGAEAGLSAGAADDYHNGYEVTVNVPTGDNYSVNQYYINQAIKAAINNDAVLNKLLVATDGPGTTLVVKSLIDGTMNANDLQVVVIGKDLATLSVTEQATALAAYKKFAHHSSATITDANTAETATVTAANAVTGVNDDGLGGVLGTSGATTLTGAASVGHNDSIIDLGTGTDVVALATGAFSNNTVVFNGYDLGTKTIVNFNNTGTGVDRLDYSSYLVDKQSASGSTDSQTTIAQTLNTNNTVEANSVTVIDFTATATDTFSGLTAEKLLAAINSTNTGASNYGNITAGTLDANTGYTTTGAPTTLVGGVGHGVVMVQNTANHGE